MTEAAKPKTETTAKAAPEANGVAAAPAHDYEPAPPVAPCGCEERVSLLEGRYAALETLNRSVGWLCIAIAAGVIYLLWNAPVKGKADGE